MGFKGTFEGQQGQYCGLGSRQVGSIPPSCGSLTDVPGYEVVSVSRFALSHAPNLGHLGRQGTFEDNKTKQQWH